MPKRIQRKREKGWRMPAGAVCCDRSTKYGNPFIPGQSHVLLLGQIVRDKRHAASLYLGFAPQQPELVKAAQAELRGKDLACWCNLCDLHKDGLSFGTDCPYCERCHCDTLGKIANAPVPTAAPPQDSADG